jgi:hypothetical protein
MDPIELLPAIPGHSHTFVGGRLTCGCTMPVVNVTPTGPTPHLNDRDRQDTCWCGATPGAPHDLHAPDFDQIARQIVHSVQMAIDGAGRHPEPQIAAQLRQIWNLRGAADLDAVNDVAHTNERAIERAIRSQDR